MNEYSFEFTKPGQPKSKCAANKKRNRSSKSIDDAVLDASNNKQQQVLALCGKQFFTRI